MPQLKTILIAVAFTAMPIVGFSTEQPTDPWSLTPFIGGYTFDGAEDIETGLVTGLRLEYDFARHLGVEATGTYLPTETQAGMDVTFYRYGLGLIYNFFPAECLNPYVSAGFGGRTNDPKGGGNVTKGIADAGAGIKYRIPGSVAALRLDLRYLAQPSDSIGNGLELTDHHANVEYTLGLVLPLGASPASAAPVDSDHDGVIDALDRCPNTPAGVKIDASGCPTVPAAPAPAATAPVAAAVVAAVVAPLDSDQDGVIDANDKCPKTQAGVKVDASGCPLDSDHDGVIDANDQCPETRSGLAVDRNGCPPPIEENVKINLNILFASGKAVIADQYTTELKKLGEFLTTYPGTTTVIEGHTDNVGAAALNKKLSQQRADAVRNYLIDKYRIDAGRITAVGYGSEKPVADNATAAGRQSNRRIEAAVETTVLKPQQ